MVEAGQRQEGGGKTAKITAFMSKKKSQYKSSFVTPIENFCQSFMTVVFDTEKL